MVHCYTSTLVHTTLVKWYNAAGTHIGTKQGWLFKNLWGWKLSNVPVEIYLAGSTTAAWPPVLLNIATFYSKTYSTTIHNFIEKTTPGTKRMALVLHVHHSKHQAGSIVTPDNYSPDIVTPDNYSSCFCTRASTKKVQLCMCTKLALAFKTQCWLALKGSINREFVVKNVDDRANCFYPQNTGCLF